MIYQHQYFQLNTESRKVFDENGKELVLTGNSYRMLVFLCENKHATLTEIGDYLDHAKEYTENHLRQYRYKIETIIGRNVIEYKNGMYSIVGDLQESSELAKVERNTDLLRSESVELGQDNQKTFKKMKFSKKTWIGIVVVLLIVVGGYWLVKNPPVKKSSAGICHSKGTDYYEKTKDFTAYLLLNACLQSGGRLPKK
ncbi:MAG: hypothetical protein US30_C0004G0083 [Candidatus Moranbacteria bacterium GW2011_GWF2_36_839]|nr:MAG: hypothetical protein US27_C0002G0086 [Candidatus Moranbacteria bacterium GW2011_GWF1_36_78]KKQ17339.1 MAG: hypothetical protein US30_C0004G0083 [Candidatus Moranbacteria bacterium GW2011_GWF2_36_839]HAT73817.1 hypothetical protein [Candidatus Moranbacteria bacterium]HBY11040.1 hypothetical protein [Candidatus Moranbacteria bacterium]